MTNMPSIKIPVKARRCDLRIWSFHTDAIGMARIIASVTIFGTAFPIKTARRFKHVPGIVKFHALGIGLHWNIPGKVSIMDVHR